MEELSTIGRPVDPGYRSNLIIILFSAASFVGFGLLSYLNGKPLLASLLAGARAFLSVFLVWALGREIDPDHHLTAIMAAVGQVIILTMIGAQGLLLLFWALLAFRILNRTTGMKAGVADTITLTGLSLWLSYSLSGVIAGASAAIFLADAIMVKPNKRHFITGGLMTGAAIYFWLLDSFWWPGFVNYPAKFGLLLAISLAFILTIYNNRSVSSTGDETGELLSSSRVQLTQLIALTVGVLYPLWTGVAGFHLSASFWAVLGASSLVNLVIALGLGSVINRAEEVLTES